MRRWLLGVLIAFDQFWNAVFDGSPDETISSRAYKVSLEGKAWGCILCRLLDLLQPGHCAMSVEWDEGASPPSASAGAAGDLMNGVRSRHSER